MRSNSRRRNRAKMTCGSSCEWVNEKRAKDSSRSSFPRTPESPRLRPSHQRYSGCWSIVVARSGLNAARVNTSDKSGSFLESLAAADGCFSSSCDRNRPAASGSGRSCMMCPSTFIFEIAADRCCICVSCTRRYVRSSRAFLPPLPRCPVSI